MNEILKKLWENRFEPDKLYLIFEKYQAEIKQLLQAEDEYKWICDTCNRNCKMKREIEPKAYKYCDIHQRYVNWQPINKQEKK